MNSNLQFYARSVYSNVFAGIASNLLSKKFGEILAIMSENGYLSAIMFVLAETGSSAKYLKLIFFFCYWKDFYSC